MRKYLTIALLTGAVILAGSSVPASARPAPKLAPATVHVKIPISDTCRNRTPRGFIWCWAGVYHANARIGVCIAKHESNLEPGATNGTHDGLFQWSRALWGHVRNQFPVLKRNTAPSAFNARTNSAYALRWQGTIGYRPWAGNVCVP